MKDNYFNFIPGVSPSKEKNDNDLWFVFYKDKVLDNKETIGTTVYSEVKEIVDSMRRIIYIGEYKGRNCFAAEIDIELFDKNIYEYLEPRAFISALDLDLFCVFSKAEQLLFWDKKHKYCGECGNQLKNKTDERAKFCSSCGNVIYPELSPAMIVAVTKGNEILLAHGTRFRNKTYSVLAGFVEPGETFEDCVKREVFEEVGIYVKNIKYFGSQPWPFPNSLMVAFTAEYESGEINPDPKEIVDAQWFTKENLPLIPISGSIARKLIEWFIGGI